MNEKKDGDVMIKNLGILRDYFLLQGADRLVELGADFIKNLLAGKGGIDGEHMQYTFSVYVVDLFVNEDFKSTEDFLDIVAQKAEEDGGRALSEIFEEQIIFLKKAVEEDE